LETAKVLEMRVRFEGVVQMGHAEREMGGESIDIGGGGLEMRRE
jgi:hypothetical protein